MANEELETQQDTTNDDLDECPELTVDQVDELFADELDAWSSEAWRALS
jgi:hypothetical protein